MSQLQALRAASSLHHVADLLDFTPKALAYILYKKLAPAKYTSFSIAKRGGGFRTINAPSPELKLLQRHLSDLLLGCVAEINTARKSADQLAHGFKPGRSIVTNAVKHRKRRYVFNLDLRDFFSTINFGRVRGFFIKDANFMLHPKVATILAQIACYANGLPQGSPCSPVISNLVGHILDIHLSKLAAKNGCTYSRYADDITFSTNKREFPSDIAKLVEGATHAWAVGAALEEIITSAGFAINPQKTRMQYRGSRQDVTGLVVNRKVNVRTEYRRTVRAFAQHLFMRGKFEFVRMISQSNGVITLAKTEGNADQLHGMIGHIDFVDRHNEEMESKRDSGSAKAKAAAKAALYSKQALYRRFLVFRDLYSAQRPVVVCEGKTDNIYLLYAIKSLALNYPTLANMTAKSKVELKIRILRALDSSIGRVLHLGHGASDLERLIERYVSEMQKFKAPGMQHAVILLVDNDNGTDEIFKTITRITKKVISKSDPSFHVAGNLYVVLTPLKEGNKPSAIEDSFADEIRDLKLNGKTFTAKSKFDTDKHFGKSILSQYVRENASTIDFSGFSEILQRISSTIEFHHAGVTAGATH